MRTVAALATVSLVVAACGERSGKVLDEPIYPPPATTIAVTTVPEASLAPAPTVPEPLSLVAPWVDGTALPERHTCHGAGTSPPLTWSNVPAGTVELVVSVVDLDADQYVHWLLYGLAPIEPGLADGDVPVAAFEWPNSSGQASFSPPCPPAGSEHLYMFTVYALNQQLEAADDATATEVLNNLTAITIAQSSVSGTVIG